MRRDELNIHNPIKYNDAIKYIVKDKEQDFFDYFLSGDLTTYNLKGEPIKTDVAVKLGPKKVWFETEEIKDFIYENY
jgi:hypothetical protein